MTAVVVVTGGAAVTGPDDALPEPIRTRALRAERLTQLVLAAGGGALADAGLAATEGPPRPGVGVVVGTAFGCFLTNAVHAERVAMAGPAAASPRVFAATVSNAAAGELGIAYRLGGPAVTLSAGRASGLLALGYAADQLAGAGLAAIVAGGADSRGDTLDAWIDAAGFRLGATTADGAALAVLEPLGAARARGARPRATLAGWAAGFGGDVDAVVDEALAEAGVARADVALVGGAGAGDTLAASGPRALLAALAEAPPGAVVVVAEACPSGHVAAVVARAGAPA
jgi:3-oxoacyl-[acyl-carrier-protein] synthase II